MRILCKPRLHVAVSRLTFSSRQVSEVENPGKLYSSLMDIIVRFAQAGLIHGDYNEFNILIKRETGEPVIIDFPQMVSTSHENAEWLAYLYSVLQSVLKRRIGTSTAMWNASERFSNDDFDMRARYIHALENRSRGLMMSSS